MQMGMESCIGKTVMAGVMGGGLGAMFGLFMASVRDQTINVFDEQKRQD
jgi:import inner membrane translocase subunit TIM22